MKKNFLLLAALLFIYSAASAQFDPKSLTFSTSFSTSLYGGGFGGKPKGLNLRLGYDQNEKNSIMGGFIYSFPLNMDMGTIRATALDYRTRPTYIDVPMTYSINFKEVYLGYQRCLVGFNDEGFSLYGSASVSLIMAKINAKLDYDRNLYASEEEPESLQETQMGVAVNLGGGASYKLPVGSMFAEGNLGIPAEGVSRYTYNAIPIHFTLNVGYKLSF